MLTLKDFAEWDSALYTERLLKQSSLNQMWSVFKLNDGQPNPDGFGFGWKIESVNGHRLLEHEGDLQGFSAIVSRYVDDGLTVVVLANLNYHHVRMLEIARKIAGIVNTQLDNKSPQPVADPDRRRALFFRGMIQKLAAGTVNPDVFNSVMRASWDADAAKGISDFLRPQGPMDRFAFLDQTSEGSNRSVRYLVHFQDGGYFTFSFSLDKEGKISKMGFQY